MIKRALIVGLLLLTAATAEAQTPGDAADTYFRQGNGLYKEQRWADARGAYESAWKLKKAHDIAANLAYAEMKLGRWRDAAEHLAFAVKTWPPTGKTDKRDYAVERLQVARKEVGALTIQVGAARADVLVDGVLVGQAPLGDEVFVEAGSHTVEAKLAGYEDAKQTVTVAKGEVQAVTVGMTVVVAVAPRSGGAVPSVVVAPPAWRPGAALIIPAGVLAGVGIALGAGLTVAANGKGGAADALSAKLPLSTCPGTAGSSVAGDCGTLKSTLKSESTLSDAAVASFIAGGALALTTAALGVWAGVTPGRAREKPDALRVFPVVSAQGGSLVMVGAW